MKLLALRVTHFADDAEDSSDLLSSARATARPSVSLDCWDDVGIQVIDTGGNGVMAAVSHADAHRIADWIRANVPILETHP